jgi:hypothetical protein
LPESRKSTVSVGIRRANRADERVSVAWTGHRPELFLDPAAARAAVVAVARDLVEHEAAEHFLVGGQRGVDTWAALAAIDLAVPFTLILPLAVAEFADGWAPADRDVLDLTVARASHLRTIGGDPSLAFTERNRRLATDAGLLVAVWTGSRGGGTAETIALARAAATRVREIRLPASPTAASARGRGI